MQPFSVLRSIDSPCKDPAWLDTGSISIRINCEVVLNLRKPVYRLFAELDAVTFAQHRGGLGIELHTMSEAALKAAWERERVLVQAALRRWDAIRNRDDSDAARIRDAKVQARLKTKRKLSDWIGVDSRTDLERQRARLAQDINEQLARVVTIRLSASLLELSPVSKVGQLGLIWLHLARAISGQHPERECRWCGEAFTSKRSDARFCSAACKLKANRATK